MRTEKYIVFKDSEKNEHKTKITKITDINEIIEEVNNNDQLHDWTVEYISCNGENAQITVKSYEDETLFHFYIKNLQEYNIDLDVVVRCLHEVDIEISNDISIIFDGVGIEMKAKEVIFEIQEKMS